MAKTKEAQIVLKELGLPPAQQNEIAALTLLALCGLGPDDPWGKAKCRSLGVSKGIMAFIEANYDRKYAPNTRETVRRQVLHQFRQACIIDYNPDDPNLPTNSPRTHYALTSIALNTIQLYGTSKWSRASKEFIERHGSLRDLYEKKRKKSLVPVRLPHGKTLELSPGKHNVLQAAVVEEFIPRFAPKSRLLYMGDAAKKNLFVDTEDLERMGISINNHDKLPDVIFFESLKNRLFLVEAVTSHGPMSPKRVNELDKMLSKCRFPKIFVSVFLTFSEFKQHLDKIAWETEVWILEKPDHMIHYDGETFLGH